MTASDLQVSNNAAEAATFGAYFDGPLAHRPLASQETVFKVLPFLVLALWGYQWRSLWVQFFCYNLGVPNTVRNVFRPNGVLRDFLPSLFLAADSLLNFIAMVSLLHLWEMLYVVPFSPGFSSNKSTSSASARGNELPAFLPPRKKLLPNCQTGSISLLSTMPIYQVLCPTRLSPRICWRSVSRFRFRLMFIEHLVSSVFYRTVMSYLCASHSLHTGLVSR